MGKIKTRLRNIVWAVLGLLLGAQLFPVAAYAASAETSGLTLKVAFPIVDGLTEISADGRRTGLVVDYLNEISNYTGWNYEYVDVLDAAYMFDDFKAGKFDLMGGAYYIPPTQPDSEYYAYPDYHTGYSKAVLLARWDDERIKNYDTNTFNGKKIGVYEKATDNIRRLEQYLEMNALSCEIVKYKYADFSPEGNLYPHLENGEVDLLLGNFSEVGKTFRAVASYNSQAYYIVSQPGAPDVLNELNRALEKIYESNPNFAEEAYESNFTDIIALNLTLNSEEQAFVNQGVPVKIAVPYDIHPLFCQDDSEEAWHNGILYDLMEAVARRTGLAYEFVKAENFAHSVSLVKEGRADVVGFYLDDTESAAKKGIALTKAYAKLNMSLVKNKKTTYPADDLTVAVVDGRELPEEIDAEVIAFSNIGDALKAVNKGDVDLVYGISSLIEKVIQDQYFSNLVSVSLGESVASVRFAVDKPAVSPTFTILNKAIGMLSEDELNSIVNRNLGSIGAGFSFTNFIYANPFLFAAIISALLLLIMFVILYTLRFRMRSANMALALEKSNADNRAKSEFLSRMSHEIRTPMNAITGLTDIVLMREEVPESVKTSLLKIRSSSRYLLSLLNDILDMSRLERGMMTIAREPFSLSRTLDELKSMMSGEADRKDIALTVVNTVSQDQFEGDAIRLKQVLTNLVSNAVKFTPAGGRVDVTVRDDTDGRVLFSVRDTGCGIAREDRERIFETFEQAGDNVSKSKGTGLGLPISRSLVRLMGGELNLAGELGQGSEFCFSIPLPPSRAAESIAPGEDKELLAGMRILLAEDNDLNAEIARDILEMAGAAVTRVSDGRQAVNEFSENGAVYHAILMDIQMPEMNGLEATRQIRGQSGERAAVIPIIAMTANSFQEDTDAAISAGMNYFICKPIDINLLYAVLKKLK